MHVRRIADPALWLDELSGWSGGRSGHPMHSAAWLCAWWQQYGADRELYALHVYDDRNRLVAVLPLYRSEGIFGGILESIGNGRVCTDYVTVLTPSGGAAPHQHERIAEALARWLINASVDSDHCWQLMEIDGVATGDAMILSLVDQLTARGAIFRAVSPMNLWRLDLPSSIDEYLRGLSKNQRKNLRRDFKALETLPELEARRASQSGDVAPALDTLIELHRRRWPDGGSLSAAGFESFVRMATEQLFERGQAEIITLEHAGCPIAADLYLLGNDGAYCYMTGMDPEAADLAPGRLINANAVLEATKRGWKFLDFLRGDEVYKARLGCQPTQMLTCRITPPALLPRLCESVRSAQRRAKGIVREMLHWRAM